MCVIVYKWNSDHRDWTIFHILVQSINDFEDFSTQILELWILIFVKDSTKKDGLVSGCTLYFVSVNSSWVTEYFHALKNSGNFTLGGAQRKYFPTENQNQNKCSSFRYPSILSFVKVWLNFTVNYWCRLLFLLITFLMGKIGKYEHIYHIKSKTLNTMWPYVHKASNELRICWTRL